jgi:fructokinase
MTLGVTYGGMEAGGTKFKCMLGDGPDQVLAETQFPTSAPAETLQRAVQFFRPFREAGRLRAIGIGTFGPCDLDLGSPTYGFITSTPKPGWQNTDVVGALRSELSVPVAFDTDVNAAALGEHTWGATVGLNTSLYLTIGTGIGGGLIVDGKPLHGMHHPEMGHIRIPHDVVRDPFAGSCPFHADCLEGLASGPAIQARFGKRGENLTDDDPFWDLEADYLASAVANYILIASPERIVLGGGIMQRTFLLPLIRQKVLRSLAGYVSHAAVTDSIDSYLVAPGLGARSGVLGAVALAIRAHLEKQEQGRD